MKSLSQIFAIINKRRFAVIWIGIVAHVNLQNLHVTVIQIVAAFAIATSIHRLCEIDVRNAIQMNIFQIHKMFTAIVIHLHQGNESNTWNAKTDIEIQHLMCFFSIVNVAFDEIAAGVHLLQVNSFKIESFIWYWAAI